MAADRVGEVLGNYTLVRVLGQGSFAKVYLGEHRYLERPAAIKVLHLQMQGSQQEAFRREARTIAQLHHPHIIGVHDFGIEEQTPYLVMDYTPNGTLRSRHPKGTSLPFEQIIAYVKQIASALDYAHAQHVIHRDIKPENILLDANQEVVLSDFGISVVQRTLDSLSTQEPAGTPLYMAPEQIQRKACAASDQYALGVMVYEWLCGEPPFRGSLYEVFAQHLHEPPPSLRVRLPELAAAVDDAVLGALAKDPQHRFPTVQEFATVLEEACFATQPLWLHMPESTRPLVRMTPLPASSPPLSAPPSEDESTQPHLERVSRSESEQAQGASVLPLPVVRSQTVAKQAKRSQAQKNRQRLLRRVHSFWIEGVLEHSLQGAALLALGLQTQPDAVANPWHLVLQPPEILEAFLPTGTRITQVYDEADEELLILGAPGSGKTTLLLELARDLLARAEQDENHPMPVIFNLSSWAMKQLPLAEWLIEELVGKYQVPRRLGQTLVNADQFLPLLDGLDEVAPRQRTRCIKAINLYHQEHGLQSLAVCCRSVDYLEQEERLQVQRAVIVQPLSPQQIEGYLQRAGGQLEALSSALQRDPDLQTLAMTPLMLGILTLAYQGTPLPEIVPLGTLPAKQQQVFATYVQRVLTHRNSTTSYTLQQTIHGLAHLARHLKRQSQTTFYIEHIQPDWLEQRWGQQIYQWLAVILPGVFLGGLIGLLTLNLFLTLSMVYFAPWNLLLFGLAGGLTAHRKSLASSAEEGREAQRGIGRRMRTRWWLVGLLLLVGLGATVLEAGLGIATYGLIAVVLGVLLTGGNKKRSHIARCHGGRDFPLRDAVGLGLLTGLSVGLIWGLSTALSNGYSYGLENALNYDGLTGLAEGLKYGLGYGQVVILLQILLRGRMKEIEPSEKILWSWSSLRKSLFAQRHLRNTLIVGLSVGLIWGVSYGLSLELSGDGRSNGLAFGLRIGLMTLTSYWALLGLFGGVSNEILPEEHRIRPNEGIRRSARNSLLVGSIGGLLSVLGIGLSYIGGSLLSYIILGVSYLPIMLTPFFWHNALLLELQNGFVYTQYFGLAVGLTCGLLSGLLNGGLACFQHSVLRSLLWRIDSIPWNYRRFLDDAAQRILLLKVGGGYIFVHRLLLDYFASLDAAPPS